MPSEPALIRRASIRNVKFGHGVTVVEPVNLYDCMIGDEAFIGPFVEVQAGARIGARTKVQSHSFVCDLVEIGSDCFIAHGVIFVNDPFSDLGPARGDRAKWRRTVVGDRVAIGSGATILPVVIGDGVVVGAGAVVTRDLTEPGVYVGNPARLLRRLDD